METILISSFRLISSVHVNLPSCYYEMLESSDLTWHLKTQTCLKIKRTPHLTQAPSLSQIKPKVNGFDII